ncbi:MAG TPA: hypothetical protein VMJ75_09980 [Candidatus Acidoferrales bacterium]|nr:hypothetical protein [Candidatus Acidoferrales bacterium]
MAISATYRIALLVLFAGVFANAAVAGTISCDNAPGNVIVNCGFESNAGPAPADWVTNAAFDAHLGVYNSVQNQIFNSDTNALMFGNFDSDPLGPAAISQELSGDVVGATYTVTFYLFYNTTSSNLDPNAFVKATVNGVTKLTISGDDAAPIHGFVQYQFNFIGTGADTMGFVAQTNPSEWFLDDVVATDAPVPEPAPWVLTGGGLLLAGLSRICRR